MLIVRAAFIDIDRISDLKIEKSGAYSIPSERLSMALVSTGKMKLAANLPNIVEWDVVLLPSQIPPDKITSLGDVTSLGGKILAVRSAQVMGGAPEPK